MPAASPLTSVLDRQLLLQLGERLKRARLDQGLTTSEMAKQAGISRTTLSAVEAGDPAPTMGTYVRVMGVLGISRDLALVGSRAPQPPTRQSGGRPAPTGAVMLSAGDARHEAQDLQSLVLHQEAVRLLQKHPELIQTALDTLDKWRAAGTSHSRILWDEWSVILHRRAWRRALSHTHRSQELRQASPLASILPPETRKRVLEQVRQLKEGVALGDICQLGAAER